MTDEIIALQDLLEETPDADFVCLRAQFPDLASAHAVI